MSSMAWRAVAVVIFVAGICIPSTAQRGGFHGGAARGGGGFAGHSAPAFHSNFAPSGSFAPGRNFAPSRSSMSVPRYSGSHPIASAPALRHAPLPVRRYPMYGDPYRYRRPYRPVYGGTVIYGVPVYAGPGYYPNFGYSDPGYYDDSAYAEPPADYAAPGDSAVAAPPAEAPPIEQAEAAPMPAYRPPYVKPQAELGPPAEPATTLVYKDGRPSEQIHNYMISSTTLYVLDDHRREIPLDEIDLPATEKINHEAGVDFQPPNFVR